METKVCKQCCIEKDLSEFIKYKELNGISYYRSKCKICFFNNLNTAEHRKKVVARVKAWRERNPDKYSNQLVKRSKELKGRSKEERSKEYLENLQDLYDRLFLSDNYLLHCIRFGSVKETGSLSEIRDRLIFNKELKSKGYAKCYSISTRLPLKASYAIPLFREKIKGLRHGELVKCISCKKYLSRSSFSVRSNNRERSSCKQCETKSAKVFYSSSKAALGDYYIKATLRSRYKLSSVDMSKQHIDTQRAVISTKNLLKELQNETV